MRYKRPALTLVNSPGMVRVLRGSVEVGRVEKMRVHKWAVFKDGECLAVTTSRRAGRKLLLDTFEEAPLKVRRTGF